MWRQMIFCACLLIAFDANAQPARPVLISQADSTRAIAVDSVTRSREPFSITTQLKFGPDSATRIMLFAMKLQLQLGESATAVTAQAEDASHKLYPLAVEHVDPVPDNPWASAVIIRI